MGVLRGKRQERGQGPQTLVKVKCADGIQRHEPFRSMSAAAHWAEWGHCCTSAETHTYERVVRG